MMEEIREVDYDLKAAIEYNISELKVEDIENVLAQVPGEADGPDWYWILRLRDGQYALVTGGCDYTGWDCRSNATVTFTGTAMGAAEAAQDSYGRIGVSAQLRDQLAGKQPYALYIHREENRP